MISIRVYARSLRKELKIEKTEKKKKVMDCDDIVSFLPGSGICGIMW